MGRNALFFFSPMNDHELWKRAVAQLEKEYHALPPSSADAVNHFLKLIQELKKSIHRIVEQVDVGTICSMCGGECCFRGKYHVTVIDVLAYLAAEKELFTPLFLEDWCPYLVESRCAMAPDFRPFNCVTFNCERVEGLLELDRAEHFYVLEKELRCCYEAIEKLHGKRFLHGLLINYEQDVVLGGGTLLGQ